jgi:hypothetical protein
MMSQRRPQPRSRGTKEPGGIEWVGVTAVMPAYVTGDGEPYRPEVLFWMGADGAILGSTTAKPGELLPLAGESLQSTIEQPMFGEPHSPTRVRVASAELADALRVGHPSLDVVCAPTPELDEMLSLFLEKMAEDGATESYLSPGMPPEAMASFFKATAALFRTKPWKLVPDDRSLFSVTIEQLGVRDAAISIIGQLGQTFGLVWFSGIDDFESYLDAAAAMEAGEEPEMPAHFGLTFGRGAELAPELREEVSQHHWEVAGPNAYPSLVAIDEGPLVRPPTDKEVAMAEVIALALTSVMAEKKVLRKAWDGGEPVSRTLSVKTHAGEVEVTVCAPYKRAPVAFDPSQEILAKLASIARVGDEIDDDARMALEDELMRRFVASPEAKGLDEIRACEIVMDLAAGYLGHTIATLGASGLREVLFELIPRKVSIEASAGRGIIEETRALYTFLKREFGLQQADACLRVLGDNAVKKLEAALSDSRNFGMAKSLVMAGANAGFDMESKEGIQAWMQSVEGKPLPSSVLLPGLGAPQPLPKKAAKAKKNKRTAARDARKKNR